MKRIRQIASSSWEVPALLVLAAIIYQPWTAAALPILDFSEFFPDLGSHRSMFGQYAALMHTMRLQGRYSPLLYAYIVAAWDVFGMWAPGWNWTYFAANGAVIIAGRRFFLNIGMKRVATISALALWTFAPAVAPGWLRPTGEPFGLFLFICAMGLAYNYTDAPDWRSRALLIAGLSFSTIAAKETLVVLLPVVWLMTRLLHENSSWSWAKWTRRDAEVTGYSFLATVLALLPVAFVALTAPPGNYAAKYGTANITGAFFLGKLVTVTFPSAVGMPKWSRLINDPAWQSWLALPNLAWLLAIACGAAALVTRSDWDTKKSRGLFWPIAVAGVWSISGVLVYLPWPTQAGFYMLPFAFGIAFGTSWLLSQIRDGRRTFVAAAAVLFVLTNICVEARDTAQLNEARIRTDVRVLAAIEYLGSQLPLFAAVRNPVPDGDFGRGLELAEYGRASGKIAPVQASDISCDQARTRAAMIDAAVIVSAFDACGSIREGSTTISETTFRRRWPFLLEPHPVVRTAYVLRSGE